ncbi:negative cofactor 2 transcription regulator complex subunit [Maudiozyma humilis]|uniref:Negative cofactor 2 transcription regulator complex subunit n=1 Tax=Maudiozyma humilis TaxID=51915 RepID=A0AAV5S4V9_MAUHU|nr:negative cofactor 2 transcription regulator complex subunit [Kazachstania humilis]
MAGMDKDDVSLPKATVQKLISEILDGDLSFNKDAREIIIRSGIEFLMILSSMSSEMAENDAKKTIAPEHVLSALRELEFDNFIPILEKVLVEFKGTQKIRERRDSKFKNSGLSEEELLRQQEELFRKSRSRLQQTAPADAAAPSENSSTAPSVKSEQ